MHPSPTMPLATMLAAPLLLLCAAGSAGQSLTFARHDVSSTDGARGIASADFDRNGWPDVAHANGSRHSVTILLNAGGTLARVRDVPVGRGPFDLVAADFNRDGMADLGVANADDDTVSVLFGEGDGSFRQVVMSATGNPRGITAADMNGDGRLDLVYTGYLDNSVNVVFGGETGFGSGLKFALAGTRPQGVAAADLDHDGLMDLAVAHESGAAVSILRGQPGTRTFDQRVLGTPTSMNVLTVADLNRDGWPDVAAASTGGHRVAVYLGSPDGHRYARSFTTGRSPRDVAAADLNVDGYLDIVTANRDNSTVSVLTGSATTLLTPAVNLAAGAGSRSLVLADLDSDGLIDIATANQNAAAFTVLSNITAFPRAAFRFDPLTLSSDPSMWGGGGFFARDFDHDGKLDVAIAATDRFGGPSHVEVLLASGTTAILPGMVDQRQFWVTDANGDGNLDVVILAGFAGSKLRTHLGDGSGGFEAVEAGGELPERIRGAEMADVNGDAVDDLVFGVFTGTTGAYALHAVAGSGDGTFGAATVTPIEGAIVLAGVADVTRDGKTDALVRRLGTNELQVWRGDGKGGFVEGPATHAPNLDGFWLALAGDLNHDGVPDIVIIAGSNAGVLLGDSGGFTWNGTLLTLQEAEFLSGGQLADLDFDGHMDIVAAPTFIAFGNGDGSFRAERFAHGPGVEVADVTRDGLPDVVYAGERGTVAALVNTRDGTNRMPVVDAGADFTLLYHEQFVEEGHWHFAQASDPDMHGLTYEWRDESGALLSTLRYVVLLPARPPGIYRLTVTVSDGRGGTASDDVMLTVGNVKEIVFHPMFGSHPGWLRVEDSTASMGGRLHDPNAHAAKVEAPVENPSRFVLIPFYPDPTQTYKLWVRLKADRNHYTNDSIWVEFSDAVDSTGRSFSLGSSGLPINLEECGGCGVSGWGWEDDGWGARNRNGVLLRFPNGGGQLLRIQTREDGVSIDQVVLSAEKYLTQRPGAAKDDDTILETTFFPDD